MYKLKIKIIALFTLSALFVLLFNGCNTKCNNNETSSNETKLEDELIIPDAGKSGGYKIETETIQSIVLVDETYKYTKFKNAERTIEYYAGPTEMIIVDVYGDMTKCYSYSFDDIGQVYENPLKHIYKNISNLDFKYKMSENGLRVYEATKIIQSIVQKQVTYTCYVLDLDWINEKTYRFKYYVYEDGSTLISAEAPDEINPIITKDTKWKIDIDGLKIINSENNDDLDLNIVEVSTGQALPPNSVDAEIVEYDQVVSVYVNSENNIEALRYVEDKGKNENLIQIINDVQIVKPIITDDMIPMTPDELQMVMMLLTMIESIV